MERTMRRKDRQLTEQEAWAVLRQEKHGVLSVVGDEGWPYAVPMNYIVWDGNLYLHCAKAGYKLDAVRRDGRVCFTVVSRGEVIPAHITTLYESVIVKGTADEVTEEEQCRIILTRLVEGLGDVTEEIKTQYVEKKVKNTALLRIRPVQVTGKANRSYIPVTQRLKD